MSKITPVAPMPTIIKAKTQLSGSVSETPKVEQSEPKVELANQPNTTEAPKEATELDPKFEALAKKESAVRTRERELQAREAQINDRIKQAVEQALSEFTGKLKSSPLDILNQHGVTYDQLVEQAVNAPDPATREIKEELKALREAQAKQLEEVKRSQDMQRESAIKQIRYDIDNLVNTDPQFETIKAVNGAQDVQDLIVKTFDETGRLMTVDEAAKLVEDELFAEATRIASLGKVKAKLIPPAAEAPKPASNEKSSTTLTNSMTSSRKLSARERAIKRFNGENF